MNTEHIYQACVDVITDLVSHIEGHHCVDQHNPYSARQLWPEMFIKADLALQQARACQQCILNKPVASGWTNIRDRFPAIGQKVLLCDNGVVQENIWTFGVDDIDDYTAIYLWEIDGTSIPINSEHAWMPLPDAPNPPPKPPAGWPWNAVSGSSR